MLVPSLNHLEQKCNALDAERCGLGIAKNGFVLDDLIKLAESHSFDNKTFRTWVDSAATRFRDHLEN